MQTGTGPLGLLGNVDWFVCVGIWLAIGHLIHAFAASSPIIGVPFDIQHLQLAGIALALIGMTVVPKQVAQAARRRYA